MHERAAAEAAQQQKAFDTYVKQTAGSGGDSAADQLSKLADLKSQGVIDRAEFEAQKAKILAGERTFSIPRTFPRTKGGARWR